MINYENIWLLICYLLLISTILLLVLNNPIYKIISLIFIFGFAAFLFIILDFFFIGLTYFIVYIGAIVILFLFVIMMVSPEYKPNTNVLWIPISFTLVLLPIFITYFISSNEIYNYLYTIWSQEFYTLTDIELVGYLIYVNNPLTIIILSILLWLILIGILCLTV